MTDIASNTGNGTTKKRALIAGAIGAEIRWLEEKLNRRPPLQIKGILCEVEVIEVGVGSIDAALALQGRLLEEKLPRIDEILFIGSAGRHTTSDDSPSHADWGFSSRFLRVESAVRRGEGRLPPALVSTVETTPGLLGEHLLTRLQPLIGTTNSLDSITLERVSAEEFGVDGLLLENMEAFGMARTAVRCGLPCSALFALTNEVGPTGSREWAQNHERMGLELQQAIFRVCLPTASP